MRRGKEEIRSEHLTKVEATEKISLVCKLESSYIDEFLMERGLAALSR